MEDDDSQCFHRLEGGSNCIFDGTSHGSPTLYSVISVLPKSPIIQISPGVVSSNGRLATCKWFFPVILVIISMICLLMSTSCFLQQTILFSYCGETFLSIGLILPVISLVFSILLAQPSHNFLVHDDFFSDALLEEMLCGSNILDLCTVGSRTGGHVVVFLSGIGGITETWSEQMEAVAEAGFSVLAIQLPGSGVLNAVTFSLPRAERVIRRVLEAFGDENDDEGTNKVLMVAWGISCHVAMYLAPRLDNLAGLVLLGSPILPSLGYDWRLSIKCSSFRLNWIAELARFTERAFMDTETRRAVSSDIINPQARSDWFNSFTSNKDALRRACAQYGGPVLCISGSESYIKEFKSYFSNTRSGFVECQLVKKFGAAGLNSYPFNHGALIADKIVDFTCNLFIY